MLVVFQSFRPGAAPAAPAAVPCHVGPSDDHGAREARLDPVALAVDSSACVIVQVHLEDGRVSSSGDPYRSLGGILGAGMEHARRKRVHVSQAPPSILVS